MEVKSWEPKCGADILGVVQDLITNINQQLDEGKNPVIRLEATDDESNLSSTG